MSWTKRQLIDEAFGELAMAGYAFDITPDEQQQALRRLDTMMATWEAKGVRLGYAMGGDSDLDQDSGLPDAAIEATYLSLAIRLAAGKGKQLSSQTLKAARDGYDTLLWRAAMPQEQQLPSTMPRGAGNKPWRAPAQPFFPVPDTGPLRVGEGGDLDFLE